MAKAYILQEKRYIEKDEDGFESLADALRGLKRKIQENCTIGPELIAIRNDRLPAPKYRASVCKYLETFFVKDNYPSHNIIDYSDYVGDPREFAADQFCEFEEFHHITDFERELGFVFSVGEKGMRLGFVDYDLMTYCYFKKYDDEAYFGIEYMKKGRTGLYIRIFKSDKDLPTKLSGAFQPVMLLDILLNETKKCPIKSSKRENESLAWRMEDLLYAKTNKSFLLPSKTTFDESTVQVYVSLLNEFGYNVKKDGNEYYIPPFICKRDAKLVLDCVNNAHIPKIIKIRLEKNFKAESGCQRFSRSDTEEVSIPVPHKGDWSAGYYALIIYHILKLCARPLPKTSSVKDSIQELALTYYGANIERTNSLPNNLTAMAAIGLPIQTVGNKYCFEPSKLLSKKDIKFIAECIAESDISECEKERLIKKLNSTFPIDKY